MSQHAHMTALDMDYALPHSLVTVKRDGLEHIANQITAHETAPTGVTASMEHAAAGKGGRDPTAPFLFAMVV